MLASTPVQRRIQRLTLVVVALLLVCLSVPDWSVRAADDQVPDPLDNTASEFASGNGVLLQRVALSNDSSSLEGDLPGALVLAPLGQMKDWRLASGDLPEARQNHAVVALGRHIFAIAGAGAASGDNENNQSRSNSAYWASVNPRNGVIELPANNGQSWGNTPLAEGRLFARPATGTPCLDAVINGSNRTEAAAAGLLTATTPVAGQTYENASGFLYVIGGSIDSFDSCGTIYGTPQVQIGRVVNGVLQGWTTTPANDLPLIPGTSIPGIRGASAVVVQRGNSAFLYLIGGRTSTNTLSQAVFYTRLNPSTGALERPDGTAGSPWKQDTQLLPLPPSVSGLHRHAAVSVRGTTALGAVNDGIFVAGGCTNTGSTCTTVNTNLYLARVQANGSLEWTATPGLANESDPPSAPREAVTLIREGMINMAGFSHGGQIYFLGGRAVAGTTDQSVLAASYNGNLDLLKLSYSSTSAEKSYFVNNGSPGVPDLLRRSSLGVAVVPAAPPQPGEPGAGEETNAAWALAIGGRNPEGLSLSDSYRTTLGGDASNVSLRASEGWYYSQYHNVRLSNDDGVEDVALVLAINWATTITRGSNQQADIELEFRTSRDLCSNPFAFDEATWRKLDGDPTTNFFSQPDTNTNSVRLSEAFGTEPEAAFEASCVQYRAFLTQNGVSNGRPNAPADAGASPRLLNVSLLRTFPSNRDLFIESFAITQSVQSPRKVSNFDLRIANLSPDGPEQTAQTAGVDEFPVVLCVAYAPLSSPQPTLNVPQLPVNDGTNRVGCAPVYRIIKGIDMKPMYDADLNAVLVNGGWRANFNNHPLLPGLRQNQQLNDIRMLFSKPGHYAVAAIIDPYGIVNEQGRIENNTGFQTDTTPLIVRITVEEEGYDDEIPLEGGDDDDGGPEDPGPDETPTPEPGTTIYLPLINR